MKGIVYLEDLVRGPVIITELFYVCSVVNAFEYRTAIELFHRKGAV